MSGTRDSMPCHQWVSAVLDAARVSVDDMERIVTRARLHTWYNAGESIEIAAHALRTWIKLGKVHERADRDAGFLRNQLKERSDVR